MAPWLALFVSPFLVGGAAVAVLAPDSWRFYGGMLFGMGATLGMCAWLSPPAYLESWKDGSDGERRTARALRPLEKEGWVVLHDLPDGDFNRDHVAVGPGGVFLIDTKVRWGEVRIDGDVLTCTRLKTFVYRERLGRHLRGAAVGFREDLRRHVSRPGFVHGVAALWAPFPQRIVESDRAAFVAGGALPEWLRRQPRMLSDEQIAEIAAAVRVLARG